MEKSRLISATNKILSIFLIVAISISIIGVVFAATPNPGHDFSTVGGGVVQGDILYGSAADTLLALPKNATASRYLSNTGTTNNPAWAQIDLTNGVTGILPMSVFIVLGPIVRAFGYSCRINRRIPRRNKNPLLLLSLSLQVTRYP